jgi:hypothetical protein
VRRDRLTRRDIVVDEQHLRLGLHHGATRMSQADRQGK